MRIVLGLNFKLKKWKSNQATQRVGTNWIILRKPSGLPSGGIFRRRGIYPAQRLLKLTGVRGAELVSEVERNKDSDMICYTEKIQSLSIYMEQLIEKKTEKINFLDF